MGADQVSFYFRYKERNPAENWKSRAEQVAEFIANIYCGSDYEESYAAASGDDLSEDEELEEYEEEFDADCSIGERYSFINCEEFYGGISEVIENIPEGMKKYYPKFIWELHYYEWYGNIVEEIYGFDGDLEYSGGYEVVGPEDEYDFSIPKPSEEEPYTCPAYVEGDYDGWFRRYWMNPVLR